MRYLVTGGFGYLGSWVVSTLAKQGHEVFILSRSSKGKFFVSYKDGECSPSDISYQFIEADLVDETASEIANKLPDDLDAIIHTASSNDVHMPGYNKSALLVNVFGTQNILEAITLKGGTLPLFLYVSTFHVYGKSEGIVTDLMPAEPNGDYGLTHLAAEEYCRMFNRKAGVPFIIVRCTNGYGAPACAPFGKWYLLLADMCRQAFHTGKICLKSPLNTRRDFVRMSDIAMAIATLTGRTDLSGKLFNIGRGASLSLGDVAEKVTKKASSILGKQVELIATQSNTGFSLEVDISPLLAATNITFSDGIEEETQSTLSFLQHFGEL